MRTATKKQWDKWMAEGELPEGTRYYTPVPFLERLYLSYYWRGWPSERRYVRRGLTCRTQREAIAKARKMLAAIKEERCKPRT